MCIEGNRDFFRILEENSNQFGQCVTLDNSFVGLTDSTHAGSSISCHGTSRLIGSGSEEFELRSLESIIKSHPAFASPGLIKIDTDGFDYQIILGAERFWQIEQPTLYFEYDPEFYEGANFSDLWDLLLNVGYQRAVVLENTGTYDSMLELSDRCAREDLQARYTGWKHQRYADVAVFTRRDCDLADRFRMQQITKTIAFRERASR